MPLAAIWTGAAPASRSGSTTASTATIRSWRIERFQPSGPRRLMTALRVASDPVPAVVGTATKGSGTPSYGRKPGRPSR